LLTTINRLWKWTDGSSSMSGSHMFSEYVLPTHDIDFYASRINNLEIRTIKGKWKVFKNEISILHTFLWSPKQTREIYHCRLTEQKPRQTNPSLLYLLDVTTSQLSIHQYFCEMLGKVLYIIYSWWAFGLLIPLSSFKELVKRQFPQLKNANGTIPKANQSSLYKALFEESFNAHAP
jgi:hypothetical protein